MIQLLNDWVKKKKNNKIITFLYAILSIVYLLLLICFFVLPFLGRIETTRLSFSIIWYISCLAILDLVITTIIKSDKRKEILISLPVVLCILSFFILSFIGSYFVQEITFLKALFYSAIGLIGIAVLAIVFKSTNVYSKRFEEKSKQAYAYKVIGVGLLIVLITFILSIKYNVTIAIYSLGIALSCYLLFNAYSNFQKWTDKQVAPFIKLFTFVDFLCGVGIGIYLIYSIKDAVLQNIITIITAAMIGGIITLLGVAWTIKQQEKNRHLDKIEERKPYLKAEEQSNLQRPNIEVINPDEEVNKIGAFGIKTLTGAYAIIDKFIINDEDYLIKSKKFVDDIGCNVEDIYINKNETLKTAFIVAKDLAQKKYKYELLFYERNIHERIDDGLGGFKYNMKNIIGKGFTITEIGLPEPYKEEPNET